MTRFYKKIYVPWYEGLFSLKLANLAILLVALGIQVI